MTESLFTKTLPRLQRAWDATSLNALQFCPRYYQYTILDGWRTPGNDLEFGAYFASAVETYKKGRLNGETKEQATKSAIRYAVGATWDDASGPWSGTYDEAWRCCGTEPYRNAKGNRAKCPWSHAGNWFPAPAPDVCGTCGSPVESQSRWVSQYTKDRYALVRLVAAYADGQPETPDDGPYPIVLGDSPAVELSFRYPLPYVSPSGEPYLACGHMDSIVQFGGEHFVADNKTTAKSLNAKYWAAFSPNTQVDLYDISANVLWPSLNVRGVLIEGAQITKTNGVKMGVGIMRRNDAQRDEFLRDLEYWLSQAEHFARTDYWPMNRRNCWLCPFSEICAKDPSKRQGYLEANYEKREWNPLNER